MTAPVRIGNVAGLFGDRFSAPMEMLQGGRVDVLTGDWLAELTMVILARTKARRADGGYGRNFVSQMEKVMGTCLERGVKVVVNAGGLDPLGAAVAVEKVAADLGLSASVAAITGDDLLERVEELSDAGVDMAHFHTGAQLGERRHRLVTANAYLGGWGIAAALDRGADIVIAGRVADAAVVLGPAAWHHRWARDDWDRLAGAVVAGHVLECGCQATGGNYSFFTEVEDLEYPGFPWADIAADGSSVIGKHDATGGEVSVGTVSSQLLYEIDSPRYHTPDVTARFDSIELDEIGPDRVAVSTVKGEPPPETLKVSAAYGGGFRNSVMIGLTGRAIVAKAALVERQFWAACPWNPEDYEEARSTLIGAGRDDPASNPEAVSYLEIAVRDPSEEKTGRSWSNTSVQIALGSIPGMFGVGPPGPARPFAVYWPTTVPRRFVTQQVRVGGETVEVGPTDPGEPWSAEVPVPNIAEVPAGPTARVAFGTVFGTRSGDKGGNANLGVFARSAQGYAWLSSYLTAKRLGELLPDVGCFPVERYELPLLWALNFVITGLLGDGVGSTLRVDPQAKGLGEYLGARMVEIPAVLAE